MIAGVPVGAVDEPDEVANCVRETESVMLGNPDELVIKSIDDEEDKLETPEVLSDTELDEEVEVCSLELTLLLNWVVESVSEVVKEDETEDIEDDDGAIAVVR